ncbi:MAG: GIY-YIG nuclease family protein [Bacteroidetes bacterium]|nr:GIY-YIG nuclease family protein [Bacteroidota bacterium]
MDFTVYVLYSSSADKHYTGFTTNLEQRLISHNQLGKGWTARFRPWQVIYKKILPTKTEAMQHEKWLKSGAGRDFIQQIPH